MNVNQDLERRIADFYATEAPRRAPDWVLGTALATIDISPQRRAFVRGPRRFHAMNTNVRLAVAAVAVIAVGAAGLAVLRPGPGPGIAPRRLLCRQRRRPRRLRRPRRHPR